MLAPDIPIEGGNDCGSPVPDANMAWARALRAALPVVAWATGPPTAGVGAGVLVAPNPPLKPRVGLWDSALSLPRFLSRDFDLSRFRLSDRDLDLSFFLLRFLSDRDLDLELDLDFFFFFPFERERFLSLDLDRFEDRPLFFLSFDRELELLDRERERFFLSLDRDRELLLSFLL